MRTEVGGSFEWAVLASIRGQGKRADLIARSQDENSASVDFERQRGTAEFGSNLRGRAKNSADFKTI